MKNIVKIFIGALMVVSVYKTFAIGRNLSFEVSCLNGRGVEQSIGFTCTTGGQGCVENLCPYGLSPQF